MKIDFIIYVTILLFASCSTTSTRDIPGQEHNPPKQEHNPPKQEHNPPKQEYIPPKQEYIPPIVEDTPLFKELKALVESDGYPYSHYETGIGLAVHGRINRPGGGWSSRNWGIASEGIKRIPGGDSSKAYIVTWDQYFKAFSDMHRFCFEDKNVNAVKNVIDQIVLETDYDYPKLFRPPAGTQWIFHPNVKNRAVCDGYADLVTKRISGLPGVEKVVKVSSRIGNHAWNEIWFKDGRILYCDSTWYDTNSYSVDPNTGNYIIDHEPHYFPTMLTFDKELFNLGRTHYAWGDPITLK